MPGVELRREVSIGLTGESDKNPKCFLKNTFWNRLSHSHLNLKINKYN